MVSTFEEVAKVFDEIKEPEMWNDAQRDLALIQAVRETVHFEYLMSEIAKAEGIPWLEESQC